MLTEKQRKFCDNYIENGLSNQVDAARRAGYKGNYNTLAVTANDNLKKPNIIAYITERTEQIRKEREEKSIAKASEVLEFFTSVMRGEVSDQFGLEADLATRITAGKELMKRHERLEELSEKKKAQAVEKKKRVTVVVNRGDLDD